MSFGEVGNLLKEERYGRIEAYGPVRGGQSVIEQETGTYKCRGRR
jgi:hypothetical protein